MVELATLTSELNSLWHELAGNPHNRASVIARILKHHADQATTQLFTDLISRQTPAGQARDEALKLLASPSLFSHIHVVERVEKTPLRVDAELGRLSIALSCAAAFRLWIVGRDITRHEKGSGIITKQALKARISALGVSYTTRHYNRLLTQGTGVFWHLQGDTIYLRSIVKVACDLVAQALEKGVATEGNQPGTREVYLDASGTLEQWEAMLYAGWVAYRSYNHDITIARETCSQLFNRHENTIRRWEAHRLAQIITKRTNYAQCPDQEHYYPYLPDHAQAYVARVRYKNHIHDKIRLRWQLPNTYHALISHHKKRGQSGRVRRAVNAGYPASEKRGGHFPHYLPTTEKLKRLYRSLKFRMGLLGDVDKPVYVYIGEHCRTGQGIFEITNTGFLFTHPNERVSSQREQEVLQRRGR